MDLAVLWNYTHVPIHTGEYRETSTSQTTYL